MLKSGQNVESIKESVLIKVANSTFSDESEETLERLPFELIPGPKANFRCCVYKEREIIRQRIRLAQGKAAGMEDDISIVQVISSGCEDCPINRFTVTDNCQLCIDKSCQSVCKFGAVSMTKDRAYIDPTTCKECGQCAKACPYGAIADLQRPCKKSCPVDAITMDENNIVEIDYDKCISCAACIIGCPFGAISDRSFIVDVIKEIKNPEQKVYAMLAPAWEGQFGTQITFGSMVSGLKELGFDDVYEVALGADYTAESEAREWAEAYKEGKQMTTSCCPAFFEMIRKHFPELTGAISSTVSPMQATARLIKTMDPGAITVFIGPCVAKKGEVFFTETEDTDYALTLEELSALLKARSIDLKAVEGTIQQGTVYGKKFCVSGGVAASVKQSLKESNENTDVKVMVCNGAEECKKALKLLKAGKLAEDFIEGMVCTGGCAYGPGSVLKGRAADKNRKKLFETADKRNINDNIGNYSDYEFSMHRQ